MSRKKSTKLPLSLQKRLDMMIKELDPMIVHKDETLPDFERLLRKFDLELCYGPCIGLTRKERLERAHQLGLKVNPLIDQLLEILLKYDQHYNQSHIEAHLNAI